MVIEAAAVPADDQEDLHDVLVGVSLRVCGRSLELALQVRQVLPNNEHVCTLLFFSS